MELVTSNNQGELDPLEIGIHCYEAVPVSSGGRGKKGGLSEYAQKVGKSIQTISEQRLAGEVAINVPVDRMVFLGHANHLAAIHKLPQGCWEACAKAVVEQNLSVADVKERIELVQKLEPVEGMEESIRVDPGHNRTVPVSKNDKLLLGT